MRCLLFLMCALVSNAALAQDTRPVMIGGAADLDACGGFGMVAGLDPNGHNALSVRAGPGTTYTRFGTIGPDQQVWICEETEDWLGVVYTTTPGTDCGVSSPIANRATYSGPCKAGWVFAEYILILAN